MYRSWKGAGRASVTATTAETAGLSQKNKDQDHTVAHDVQRDGPDDGYPRSQADRHCKAVSGVMRSWAAPPWAPRRATPDLARPTNATRGMPRYSAGICHRGWGNTAVAINLNRGNGDADILGGRAALQRRLATKCDGQGTKNSGVVIDEWEAGEPPTFPAIVIYFWRPCPHCFTRLVELSTEWQRSASERQPAVVIARLRVVSTQAGLGFTRSTQRRATDNWYDRARAKPSC